MKDKRKKRWTVGQIYTLERAEPDTGFACKLSEFKTGRHKCTNKRRHEMNDADDNHHSGNQST